MATRIRQKAEKRNAEPKFAHATAKYVRMSPSKIAYILDLIRGKNAQEAVAILENMPDKGAFESLKVLKSAIANAENNNGMNPEKLYVEECYANKGPTMKRVQPRARGSAYRIEKRMSHITIVLNER